MPTTLDDLLQVDIEAADRATLTKLRLALISEARIRLDELRSRDDLTPERREGIAFFETRLNHYEAMLAVENMERPLH